MSATLLKFFALFFMTLDHIYDYFPGSPLFFKWIGRISAPIFLFLSCESYGHTSKKIKYMIRLYISSLLMGIINFWSLSKYKDIPNNIFRTLLIAVLSYYIYDKIKEKKYKYFYVYTIWQLFAYIFMVCILQISKFNEEFIVRVVAPLLGSVFYVEGGLLFIILSLLFYIFHNRKLLLSLSFTGFAVTYTALFQFNILERTRNYLDRISGHILGEIFFFISVTILNIAPMNIYEHSLLYDNYVWMMLLSIPFILSYNGKRGIGMRYFFYLYYPLHLIILSIISFEFSVS